MMSEVFIFISKHMTDSIFKCNLISMRVKEITESTQEQGRESYLKDTFLFSFRQ